MNWDDYVKNLLASSDEFEELELFLKEDLGMKAIPPIVKASVLMLDKLPKTQSGRSVFVFPERFLSGFIFVILKPFMTSCKGQLKQAMTCRV